MAKSVFISYSHEDSDFARDLAKSIREHGSSVFMDTDLQVGGRWAEILREEIDKASALILIMPSHDVANRNNLWFEAGAAKALGKQILAVRAPGRKVSKADLPTDLADLLVLDTETSDLNQIASVLVQAVPSMNR